MANTLTPLKSLIDRSLLKRDPHQILGLHINQDKTKTVRLYRPGANEIYIELFGKVVPTQKVDALGIFECLVPEKTSGYDYKVYHNDGSLTLDPYAFMPTLGEQDIYYFNKGVHYQLYDVLGGRLCTHQGVKGAKFSVWAPNARSVSLVTDFNHWDPKVNPMRMIGSSGIWEIFIPDLTAGTKYKFCVTTQEEVDVTKADPLALSSELRPKTASVLTDVNAFKWNDKAWMDKRGRQNKGSIPVSIYEVHLGSWKRNAHGEFLSYREIAPLLAAYCQEMGFTHVELLPIMEHPLDESWGYQVTGFYATTSRFGTPEDFQYFVDYLHQKDIGVFLDWVPAHFPADSFSLACFDGTALYEHADNRQGWHPHWNTHIFNYGRVEVTNFLIASALFWLDKMHIDGLRVDAVASMLYLDYGRKEGEWIPNIYGKNENLEAIEFLKHLNSVIHEKFPAVYTMAEDSSAFVGVTHPLEWGGLGFDLKWNMGWMNDTLRYFKEDPLFRKFHHHHLTFGLMYLYSERFMSVLSHDEVVHGKASLISKMPGDEWQKFANLRLLYSYMMCYPGKNLLFMGGEIGQWTEWNAKESLQWHLLNEEKHKQLHNMIKKMNAFYKTEPALWAKDHEVLGFEWIDFSDVGNSVISYLRKDNGSYLACVHNFTPNYYPRYFVRLMGVKEALEVFNTDAEEFGGSGRSTKSSRIMTTGDGRGSGFEMELAPLATMIFEVYFGD